MELASTAIFILIVWFSIRLMGRIFDGPRYRRRRDRRDARKYGYGRYHW